MYKRKDCGIIFLDSVKLQITRVVEKFDYAQTSSDFNGVIQS